MPTNQRRNPPVRGQECLADCVSAFSDTLQAMFGQLDWLPIPDGTIHRFRVPGDRAGSLNGWYVLHPDGIASGSFGSWKVGSSHTWSSREPVDHLENQLIRQRIEQAKRKREADEYHRQRSSAMEAERLWRDAHRADPNHPYLIRKGNRPHGLRQHRDMLLVPLYHGGQPVNLQRIWPNGSKRFLSGGRVKACYSPLGIITPGQPLYICEGWATGATIHESTGHAVACALNAGNLLAVGECLRRRHPDAVLIVAGDDDRQTKGNPGKTAAIRAAAMLGCGLVLPQWPSDAPPNLSDFNDLANWRAHA